MAFSIYTGYRLNNEADVARPKELFESTDFIERPKYGPRVPKKLFTISQVRSGIIDLIALTFIALFASLIVLNHAQLVNLPGLATITNEVAYGLFGAATLIVLIDTILLAVQISKKLKHDNAVIWNLREDLIKVEKSEEKEKVPALKTEILNLTLNLTQEKEKNRNLTAELNVVKNN